MMAGPRVAGTAAIVVLSAVGITSSGSVGRTQAGETTDRPLALRGLPYVPKGVDLGIQLAELLGARPNVRAFRSMAAGGTRRSGKDGADPQVYLESEFVDGRPGTAMLRDLERQKDFAPPRLAFAASYFMKERKCIGVSIRHNVPWEDFDGRRKETVRAFVSELRGSFKRMCRETDREGKGNMILPALSWETDTVSVTLSVTPDPPEARRRIGFIQIWAIRKDAGWRRTPVLPLREPRERDTARLFDSIDSALTGNLAPKVTK